MINQDDRVFSKNRKSSDRELSTLSSSLPSPAAGLLCLLWAPCSIGKTCPPGKVRVHTPLLSTLPPFCTLQKLLFPFISLAQLPLCRPAFILPLEPPPDLTGLEEVTLASTNPATVQESSMSGLSEVQQSGWARQDRTGVARTP